MAADDWYNVVIINHILNFNWFQVGYPIVLVVILLQRGAIAESSSQQSKQAQGSNRGKIAV